jgi:hypothetical protein
MHLFASTSELSIQEARLAARTSHPAAVTAGWADPIPEREIARLQLALRAAADERGWPRPLDLSAGADVDRAWAPILFDLMDIPAADAAGEGVWSFLALVVVPDLSKWRFPNGGPERFLGVEQHVFARLWTRRRVLGGDLFCGAGHDPLDEDELVALFRRRDLIANPAVARSITRTLLRGSPGGPERPSRLKRLLVDLLRQTPALCLDVLDDDELDAVVAELLSESSGPSRAEVEEP